MFHEGIWIGAFGPKKEQAEIVYRRTRMLLKAAEKEYGLTIDMNRMDRFILTNGSLMRVISASPSSSIEGETFHLIELDENQDIHDSVRKKSIYPMGAHTRATIVNLGTPSLDITSKRYFYDMLQRPDVEHKFIFDYLEMQKYSEPYRLFVIDQKHRISEDSDEFKAAFRLIWCVESSQFTTVEQLMALGDKTIQRTKQRLTDHLKQIHTDVYVGIDVAKDPDSTVVTVVQLEDMDDSDRKMIRILDWMELGHGMTYDRQIPEIFNMLKNYSIMRVSIDSRGVGDPVFDLLNAMVTNNRLPQHRLCTVIPHSWTAISHHDLFNRLHLEWWENRVIYPADGSRESRNFIKQFQYLGKEYKGNLMKCHHPQEQWAHDDYCSSLALCIDAIGLDYFDPSKTGRKRDLSVTYAGGQKVETRSTRIRKPKPHVIMPSRGYGNR